VGEYKPEIILNDFVFLPSENNTNFHLLCANDLNLTNQGYVSTSSGSFEDFKTPKEFAYPSEPCVSLAVIKRERTTTTAGNKQENTTSHYVVYGVTMLGDILLWDPLNATSIRLLSSLKSLLNAMPVVERWVLLDVVRDSSSDTSQPKQKLSKREAVDVKSTNSKTSRSGGEMRLFTSMQDLNDGAWNLVDFSVDIEADGSFKRSSTQLKKYPCERTNPNEAPDWVIGGGMAVIAGRNDIKAWILGNDTPFSIPYWGPKKVNDLSPSVCRISLNRHASIMCVSEDVTVSVYTISSSP